ncbi:MAG: hypothetical protein EOP06_02025, partial [Proteobacteria bacterium]
MSKVLRNLGVAPDRSIWEEILHEMIPMYQSFPHELLDNALLSEVEVYAFNPDASLSEMKPIAKCAVVKKVRSQVIILEGAEFTSETRVFIKIPSLRPIFAEAMVHAVDEDTGFIYL